MTQQRAHLSEVCTLKSRIGISKSSQVAELNHELKTARTSFMVRHVDSPWLQSFDCASQMAQDERDTLAQQIDRRREYVPDIKAQSAFRPPMTSTLKYVCMSF